MIDIMKTVFVAADEAIKCGCKPCKHCMPTKENRPC